MPPGGNRGTFGEPVPGALWWSGVARSSAKGFGQDTGAGELATVLHDRLKEIDLNPTDIVLLCDHGSPVARVANAKMAVLEALEQRLKGEVLGCCMERRDGEAYAPRPKLLNTFRFQDFNGPLLKARLEGLSKNANVKVALLFLQALKGGV